MSLNIKNSATKSLAAILALTMTFSASAADVPSDGVINHANNTASSTTTAKKNNVKEFCKNHPTLSKALIITAVVAGASIIHKINREWNLKDVTTAIDGFSDAQVKEDIDIQVDIYKNRAPDVFKIEDEVIEKMQPRTLLLTLMRLNQLFEKYGDFTGELISYKRHQVGEAKKFTFRLMSYENDGRNAFTAEGLTERDLGGFAFGNWSANTRELLYKYKECVESNFWAQCDLSQLIESIVTHEFGHAMESLYLIKKYDLDKGKIFGIVRGMSARRYAEIAKQPNAKAFFEQDEKQRYEIKSNIIKIAHKSYGETDTINGNMTCYGRKNSSEFFAEAFANMECCDNPTPVGRATKDYIKNWFV